MGRRVAAVAAAVALGFTGCLNDMQRDFDRLVRRDAVRTPKAPKVAPASVETAQRVEDLGRQIIAQNTFTGLDPILHTMGVPEPVLFHRGTAELFISEGLVKQCKTTDELAAVLCSELGKMMAEKRLARGVGRDKDPIPSVALPDTGFNAEGTRAAELALQQQPLKPGDADPVLLAKDLLRGAGFDPAELDRAEPLLKQSSRGEDLEKQMSGSAPAPTWEK
jgi:hypothetical protein